VLPEEFQLLMRRLRLIAKAVDRCIGEPQRNERALLSTIACHSLVLVQAVNLFAADNKMPHTYRIAIESE